MNITFDIEPMVLAESYVDALMHDNDAHGKIVDFVMMIDRQCADMDFTMELLKKLIHSVACDGEEFLSSIEKMVKKEMA